MGTCFVVVGFQGWPQGMCMFHGKRHCQAAIQKGSHAFHQQCERAPGSSCFFPFICVLHLVTTLCCLLRVCVSVSLQSCTSPIGHCKFETWGLFSKTFLEGSKGKQLGNAHLFVSHCKTHLKQFCYKPSFEAELPVLLHLCSFSQCLCLSLARARTRAHIHTYTHLSMPALH